MTRVALTFPGQGSQCAGMAAALLDRPVAGRLLEVAAAEGLDLASALSGDDDALRPTEIAQPALLFTGVVLASVLPGELEVVATAGHSVGEYAALVAAGALDAADALRLVIARGRAMAAMREGTMAALLGADAATADAAVAEAARAGVGPVVVANRNAPGQVVVSGTAEAVSAVIEAARARGVRRAMPLRVSGAFHSPLMREASAAFAATIAAAPLRDPRVPVACNVDGALVRDTQGLRDRLTRQLESAVLWEDCVHSLVAAGAEVLVELGPGGVLTGLAKRIVPQTPARSAATPADVAALRPEVGAGA